ncbi:MAG TPA: ABC transporter ATP-binding protein [Acidobacteriaceae bacterium]|nr:ABC transporter ATP-binding protein [Acidobacteriaceae bacterium]
MTLVALLSVSDLTIAFGSTPAVRSLSLSVGEGQSLGLVGESGSGKSVTALAILGLLGESASVAGSIHYDGRNLIALAPEALRRLRGRQIAMVFQEPMTALNPVMPIGEQIAEAVRVHQRDLSRRDVRRRVIESMHSVALPDPEARYNHYPHQFSGGQRQRILIAMAIVNRPRLLIADEPTTALDVTVQAQILELLRSLRERFGLAMLFISHDLAVVAQVADRVAVMRHGLLLEEAPSAALFRQPLHAYTRSLLGAVPTMKTNLDRPLATLQPRRATSVRFRIGEPTSPPPPPLREAEPGHWVREPWPVPEISNPAE